MQGLLLAIDRMSAFIGKLFAWSVVVLTLTVTYEIVARKLFTAPTTWGYDVSYMLYGTLFMMAGGYALSRYTTRGTHLMGVGMFLSYLVPQALLFVPLARIMAQLHLNDSIWSLMLVYPTMTVPFCTWFMMGYFRGVPRQLDEAARIDGASTLQVLRRISFHWRCPA